MFSFLLDSRFGSSPLSSSLLSELGHPGCAYTVMTDVWIVAGLIYVRRRILSLSAPSLL